jgi:hypothetical protein
MRVFNALQVAEWFKGFEEVEVESDYVHADEDGLFPRVLRFPHLFIFQCGLSCSAAQPRRISTPHRPSIEFA